MCACVLRFLPYLYHSSSTVVQCDFTFAHSLCREWDPKTSVFWTYREKSRQLPRAELWIPTRTSSASGLLPPPPSPSFDTGLRLRTSDNVVTIARFFLLLVGLTRWDLGIVFMNWRRSLATCPLTSSRLSCRGSERSPRERTRSSWVRSCTGAVPPSSLWGLPPFWILSMPHRIVSTDSKGMWALDSSPVVH